MDLAADGHTRILGIDPGLAATGWGLIEVRDNRLSFVADGTLRSDSRAALADRLAALFDGISELIEAYAPDEVAVEETFVNANPKSTLKLGQARGVALLAPPRPACPWPSIRPTW